MARKGRPLEATSPDCEAWEICDDGNWLYKRLGQGGSLWRQRWSRLHRPGIPGSSLSALSGRKLRQNHEARLGQGGLCSQRCCHQPRARAAKVSLLPSRYAFSELDRIIDTCRAGWSLDEIWNNEIMTTLARSDRHWMYHANFLLILSLNLTFRLQVWMRQLVRWPLSS